MPPPQKLPAIVEQVVPHGDRVYTVTLRPARTAPRFRAGQFLQLALDQYEPTGFWPESRAFSISSAPSQREQLRITYSVQGRFTARMEHELQPGGTVWIKMPYGEFIIEPSGEVVLLAGGTGMTAFTAFLEQLNPTDPCTVSVAYGARYADLLVYRGLLDRVVARIASVSALYFLEDAADTMAIAGRMQVAPIWDQLQQPLQAQYFIAGPPAMIAALRAELQTRNVSSDAIHIDAWE